MKKILLTGIKPSGQIHIGNYFGMIKPSIELVNNGEYESYMFVADYHSLTTLIDRNERIKNTFDIIASFLACGVDQKKVSIFKQSDVPSHTELCVILNNVTPIQMLFSAHAFKDKVGQTKEEQFNFQNLKNINAGLFDYPVLMAADILIYNSEIVPVGKDQEQHVEYAREIAKKYNLVYKSETFKMPQALIKKEIASIPGLDGQKMSKSKGNDISIFSSPEEIKERVSKIKTDSLKAGEKKNPEENNIYKIHKLFLNEKDKEILRGKFLNSDQFPYSYQEAKAELAETIIQYFSEIRKKYKSFTETEAGRKKVMVVMAAGAKRANIKAKIIMKKVRQETGLDF